MTPPPLGGISGTAKAILHIRVPLVSCGQVCLHLKYDALQLGLHRVGVAAIICMAPRDDGAVFFHCNKSTGVPDNVIDTASQLILHSVGVAATTCISPGDHGTVLLHCSEGLKGTKNVINTASQLRRAGVNMTQLVCDVDDSSTLFAIKVEMPIKKCSLFAKVKSERSNSVFELTLTKLLEEEWEFVWRDGKGEDPMLSSSL